MPMSIGDAALTMFGDIGLNIKDAWPMLGVMKIEA